jgi:hypothetical protein
MNDETPDSMADGGASHVSTPTPRVEAAGFEGSDEYLLNDIGVALRLLSEREW